MAKEAPENGAKEEDAAPKAEEAAEEKKKAGPFEGWGEGIKNAFTLKPLHKDRDLSDEEDDSDDEDSKPKKKKKFLGIPLKASTKVDNEHPNDLHSLILAKKWEEVISTIDSEEGTIFVTEWYHKDLPIHMAMDSKGGVAPDEVLKKLVTVFPESCKERGSHRRLPLQLARKHKCPRVEVYEILIRAWPEALDENLQPADKKFEAAFDKKTVRSHDGSWPAMPSAVRSALDRSTHDWKMIIKMEADRDEMNESIAKLEKSLRIANRNIKASEDMEFELGNFVTGAETAVAEYKIRSTAQLDAVFEALASFREKQDKLNEEFRNDIGSARARDVVNKAAFRGQAEDLLASYEESAQREEALKKDIHLYKLKEEVADATADAMARKPTESVTSALEEVQNVAAEPPAVAV